MITNPYHKDFSWEKLAATDPHKWWNLRKTCILEEIEELNKRARTKQNLAKRKVFDEMLEETEKVLSSIDKR